MEESDSEGNKNNRPSSLPANYVTLLQLKERWLKEKEREQKEKEEQEQKEEEERLQREREERERAQKEEEELRLQKLKEEEANSQKPDGVVVDSNYRRRFDRRQFRPVDRNVSECDCEGAQLDGKSEEPKEEEEKKKKKKRKSSRKRRGQDGKKDNQAENKEVSTEKEGAVQASSREGNSAFRRNGERKRISFEFRAKSKNGEEIELKFRDLSLNGETAKGDDRLGRPNGRNVGAKEKIKPKVRDLVMKSETERGNDDGLGRTNGRPVGAKEEIEPKVRDLSMNGETGDDRLRGPNSKEDIEPKVRDLSTERGEDGFRRRKGKNVGGKDETGSKIRDVSMNAETKRGDDRLWRSRRFDHRRNGKTWDHKKEKLREGPGLAWVKKGEASDVNVGGVQSSEHFISGSTGTS